MQPPLLPLLLQKTLLKRTQNKLSILAYLLFLIKPREFSRGFIFARHSGTHHNMKHILAIFLTALFLLPAIANAESQPFSQWLASFERDALSQGISQNTLDDAFEGIEPNDRVLELDHKQPESRLTLDEYIENVLTPKRIKDGRKFFAENRSLLKTIGTRYGVQPRFIVALWGIETNYGRNTGGFSTIESLATLAYDGRRSEFFRGELINALQILQNEHMQADDMEGSWAGALGQCQFMPSTFLKYAVDYNHSGKHDIWDNKADVFASIANYLKSLGWNEQEGWGRPVALPDNFDRSLTDIKIEKTLAEWKRLGIALPAKQTKASLILVGEADDAVPYIIYGNYKALLQWNRSRFFATAVGTLADKIGK